MSNQFHGTIEELKEVVSKTGRTGKWQENKSSNSYQFKSSKGEILNWWPSKRTYNCQGTDAKSFMTDLTAQLSETIPIALKMSLNNKKIFIVHGHDRTARDQLELILMRLGLQPFILQNSEQDSKTLIEALEVNIYKESGFGIILMTPDDYGYSKEKTETDCQPRARQNVIFEMGMVMASLGREHMLILKKGALEVPSDAANILRHEFNDHVKEIVPKLVMRLQKIGFEIDPSKIAKASA